MTSNANDATPPDNTEEAERIELGEPTQVDPDMHEKAQGIQRPDPDRRQSLISTQRKQMGPPSPRSAPRGEAVSAPDNEDPTDPPA